MELTRLSGGCYHLYIYGVDKVVRRLLPPLHGVDKVVRRLLPPLHGADKVVRRLLPPLHGVDKVVRRLLPPLHGVDKVVRRLLRGCKAILLVNNLVTDLSHGFNDLQGFMYIVWKAIYAIYGGATAYRRSGNFYVKIKKNFHVTKFSQFCSIRAFFQ